MTTDHLCSICGKKMIKCYEGRFLASYPPRYPWYWWCVCGNDEAGGIEMGRTEEDIARENWEKINET